MASNVYDKIKRRFWGAGSSTEDASASDHFTDTLETAMMAAMSKTFTAAEIERKRLSASKTLNAKDFWGNASPGVAMQGGVSPNQLSNAAPRNPYTGLGLGNIDWGDWHTEARQMAQKPRPTELPAGVRAGVWRNANTDRTEVRFDVQCRGGAIQLTFPAPGGEYTHTPRALIEDLQQQLVRQLALIALKED